MRHTYAPLTDAALICVTCAGCKMFPPPADRGGCRCSYRLCVSCVETSRIALHLVLATRSETATMLDMQPQLARSNGARRAAGNTLNRRPVLRRLVGWLSSDAEEIERRRGAADRDWPDRAAGARPAALRQLPRAFRRWRSLRRGAPLARSGAHFVRLRRSSC